MLWVGQHLGAAMPRPRREDVPESATSRDVLFELRAYVFDDETWKHEHTPALIFAARARALVMTGFRLGAYTLPIATVLALAWLAR